MKYYVYLTVNNLNPTLCYVGMTKNPIETGYIGSGTYFTKAIKKYGKKNFTRYDLGSFDDIYEANYWEGFYIKNYKTLKEKGGYNLSPTGGLGVWGGEHSEECKKIMSENNSGEKNPMYGSARFGEKNPFYGKTHTEEAKQKMSEGRKKYIGENASFYGKTHTDETKEKIRKSNTGKKQSDETKEKKRKSSTGKKHSEESKQKMSDIQQNMSDEAKAIKSKKISEALKGRIVSEETKQKMSEAAKGRYAGEKNPMYGKGYKIAGEKNGMYGKPAATRGMTWKVENRKPTPLVTCDKCGKVGAPNVMYRFHFDKCGIKDEEYSKKLSAIKKEWWAKKKNE